MTTETVQADAAALVAMSVADIVQHFDGVDLETLKAALDAEQVGAARKGAIAALNAAISGHPEQAAAAALAADANSDPLADKPTDVDAVSAAPARPHDSLVSQLELRWAELKYFVSGLEGELDGELGKVLSFVREF